VLLPHPQTPMTTQRGAVPGWTDTSVGGAMLSFFLSIRSDR
jgi:hypothetical protein